jgi:cytochrome c oxidase subunit 2
MWYVTSALLMLMPVIAKADAAQPWQYGFQDPATPVMQGIIDLHHDIMFFLVFIIVFVMWMMFLHYIIFM